MSQSSEFRVQSSEFRVQSSAVPEPVEGKARHFLYFLYPSIPRKDVSMCFNFFLQDTLTRPYKKTRLKNNKTFSISIRRVNVFLFFAGYIDASLQKKHVSKNNKTFSISIRRVNVFLFFAGYIDASLQKKHVSKIIRHSLFPLDVSMCFYFLQDTLTRLYKKNTSQK